MPSSGSPTARRRRLAAELWLREPLPPPRVEKVLDGADTPEATSRTGEYARLMNIRVLPQKRAVLLESNYFTMLGFGSIDAGEAQLHLSRIFFEVLTRPALSPEDPQRLLRNARAHEGRGGMITTHLTAQIRFRGIGYACRYISEVFPVGCAQLSTRAGTMRLVDIRGSKHASRSLIWVKSSLSMYNGNCVEVAGLAGDIIRVRDSKDPLGGTLRFTPAEWDAFVGGVQLGEFNWRPHEG